MSDLCHCRNWLKTLICFLSLEGDSWNPRGDFSWVRLVTQLRQFNNDILVMVWVGPDGKDSNDFIVQLDQSDLLLPSADYYKVKEWARGLRGVEQQNPKKWKICFPTSQS